MIRTDSSLDFDWGAASPVGGVATDNFFVRWMGNLGVDTDATYTFSVLADDGVRLWIDGILLIDAWRIGDVSESDERLLAAGNHTVVLEYFDSTGDAMLKLSWSSPALPEEIIPADHLTPPLSDELPPMLVWVGDLHYEMDGLHAESGNDSAEFTYRIKYVDNNGLLPAEAPKVHILEAGEEIAGSPFGMIVESPGIYAYATKLPEGKEYGYFFTAQDSGGLQAVGMPSSASDPSAPVIARSGPVVQNVVALGDIDESGRVDGFDLGKLAISFGSYNNTGDPLWNDAANLNNDALIDGSDLNLLIDAFLK
jgi:hypothetical protein